MSRYIALPPRGTLSGAQLHVRISTPTNKWALEIIPELPTVVFIHAIFQDSNFFAAQFQDPDLYKKYNLVAFDNRGLGETKLLGELGDSTFSFWEVAEDVYLGMKALGIKKAHIVGIWGSTVAATRLAAVHPDVVDSLSLVTPLPYSDPFLGSEGYDDSFSAGYEYLEERDWELAEDIVSAAWDFSVGPNPSELVLLQRQMFIDYIITTSRDGRFITGLPYVESWWKVSECWDVLGNLKEVKCPVLILQIEEVNGGENSYEQYAEERNANNHENPNQIIVKTLGDLPVWMSLSRPDKVNPALLEHVSAVEAAKSSNTASAPIIAAQPAPAAAAPAA